MTTYEWLSVGLTLAGLIFLAIYVLKTWAIAEATNRHNEIISRPFVTVKLIEPSKLSHLQLVVKNHTAIHANVRIGIVCKVTQRLEDGIIKTGHVPTEGAFSGKEIWDISARDEFIGHTRVDALKDLTIGTADRIVLDLITDVSAFGTDTFYPNPLVQYYWNAEKNKWTPNPVPEGRWK